MPRGVYSVVALALCVSVTFAGCDMTRPATDAEYIKSLDTITLPKEETSALYGELVKDFQQVVARTDRSFEEELYFWKEVNVNTCALLDIEGLDIHEPVLKATVDNQQWLRTNIYGEYAIEGSVFLDVQCDLYTNPIKLIHGHNMKDGTMFSNIPVYLELESCSDAPAISLYTEDGMLSYEVFAVLSLNSKEEALPITPIATREDIDSMATEFMERSLVPGGVINSNDLLILNTCWYGESGLERNLHCIVVASRV